MIKLKVRFFFISDGNAESSVMKKVLTQTSILNRLEVDIALLLVTIKNCSNESFKFLKVKKIDRCQDWNIFSRFFRLRKIAGVLEEELICLGENDFLYIRYPYPIFYYPKNLLKKYRKCKIIFEHIRFIPHCLLVLAAFGEPAAGQSLIPPA